MSVFVWLHLQTNKSDAEFVAAPDWYYGFEYPEEIKRGYDGYEDLLTTGYFEMPIKKGESIILCPWLVAAYADTLQ